MGVDGSGSNGATRQLPCGSGDVVMNDLALPFTNFLPLGRSQGFAAFETLATRVEVFWCGYWDVEGAWGGPFRRSEAPVLNY